VASMSNRQQFESMFARQERVPVSSIWQSDFEVRSTGPAVPDEDETAGLSALAPDVVKVNYAAFGGSGTYLRVRVGPRLVVGLVNAVMPEPARARYVADQPLLMLRASLSSDCAYTVPGLPKMVFDRPEIVIACVPRGQEIVVDVHGRSRQHSVLLLMNAEEFLPSFGLQASAVPPALGDALGPASRAGRLITLPLDSRLAGLVETMTDPLPSAHLQRLATLGALQQLVAWTLEAAERKLEMAGPAALRPRDVALAYAARELMDRQVAPVLPLPTLAHAVGSNRKTLNLIFRRVFGTTVAAYAVERRMHLAQALLLDGRMNIAQVGDRVGYQHQSSFTAAFRAHAGMSPRAYQRQRAALDLSLGPAQGKPRIGRIP
jgi:AraC-like DNA-binding protein